jgi:biopolymer transport protein ExbD
MAGSIGGDSDRLDVDPLEDDFPEVHDINVTPFIDVMLVLLIIFMVAAPLSTVDLPVDLPSSTAVPQKKPDKPLYVTIAADLAVAVGEIPISGSISCTRSTAWAIRTRTAASSCARTAPCLTAS